MRKWEYFVLIGEESTTTLNRYGQRGWELVGLGKSYTEPFAWVFYFKREMVDEHDDEHPNIQQDRSDGQDRVSMAR
jgi:hypothetical protein